MKKVRTAAVTVAVIAALAAAAVPVMRLAVYEYELDMASCPSDNLGPALMHLEKFQEARGRYPRTGGEFYAFVREQPGGRPREAMHRFHDHFILMPPGLSDPEGGPVLLMCPPASHGGWPRKYAFGVSARGMVRVSSKNEVTAYRRKAK